MIAAAFLLAAGWLSTTTSRENAAVIFRLYPAIGVLLGTLVFAIFETSDLPQGTPAGTWYAESTPVWIGKIPFPAWAIGLGVCLFLLESANIVVRSVLYPRSLHAQRGMGVMTEPLPDLRGSRLIVQLERLGLLMLSLAGMFMIDTALISAKGDRSLSRNFQ